MRYTFAVAWAIRQPIIGAFSSLPNQSQPHNIITSHTTCFAGGGFGASKSVPSKKKKSKKTKSKSIGFLDEMKVTASANKQSNSEASTSPKLDRFGLPIITEDDVFPPLEAGVTRIPLNDADYIFNKEQIEDATKNHLGVNLSLFGEDGQSLHEEHYGGGESSATDTSKRWELKLLHKDPPVFQIDNFFTEEECELYKSMTTNTDDEQQPKAVQITSPTFSSHSISRRTSTTWFCRYDGVPTLLAKAQQLLNVNISQMEEPQIVRYRNGQEFSWHYDEIPQQQLNNGGQRLATLLVYLNDLEEDLGGGTVFRDLEAPSFKKSQRREKDSSIKQAMETNQLTVRPKTGTALLFFPSYKDGTPDIRTLHKGEVAKDTKMIAQLWIHQREYQAGVPEGNLQSDALEGVEKEAIRLGFL